MPAPRTDDDIASHATRSARLVLGLPWWTSEDWEDLHQEARFGVWRAQGEAEPTRFVYARRRVMTAWVRQVLARNPANTMGLEYAEALPVVEPDREAEGLDGEIAAAVANMLLASRKQRGPTITQVVLLEVAVLDLLSRGYNSEGIAIELVISLDYVKRIRKHLKVVLSRAAQERGVSLDEIQAMKKRTPTAQDRASYTRRPRRSNVQSQ